MNEKTYFVARAPSAGRALRRKSRRIYDAVHGLSLLVCASSAIACDQRAPTPATGMGPHYVSEVASETALWRPTDSGEPVLLRSRVVDTCGRIVPGARVQIWHADADGVHDNRRWRTDLVTDANATFEITTVLPGYAGGLPRHFHVIVSHSDHAELITRLFFNLDPMIQGQDLDDLVLHVDEVKKDGRRAWVTSFEFVLASK